MSLKHIFNLFTLCLFFYAAVSLVGPIHSLSAQEHDHGAEDAAPQSGKNIDNHDHEEHASETEKEDHEGHEMESSQTHEEDDDHEAEKGHEGECEGDDHSGHDHGDEEQIIFLSKNAISLANISTAAVAGKKLERSLELSGEVKLNDESLAHIVPRFPGIALKVRKRIGDYVRKDETLAIIESNESLTKYSVKSLISGTVIEKHLTMGEFVSEESVIYTIANLSTVWVDLAVYSRDAPFVKRGQHVIIRQIDTDSEVDGELSFISSLYDSHSRSFIARVVVPNKNNEWRPGTFVRATVSLEGTEKVPVVENDAVQILNDESVVFVPGEAPGIFNIIEVETGAHDALHTEILSGLHEGDLYVRTGAYELKAKLITSTLDSHAGHGH